MWYNYYNKNKLKGVWFYENNSKMVRGNICNSFNTSNDEAYVWNFWFFNEKILYCWIDYTIIYREITYINIVYTKQSNDM